MKVNCLNCKHFYVTWDSNAPKGCHLYGFKTIQLPSTIVYQETKRECLSFIKKKNKIDKKRDDNKKHYSI